MLRVLCLLLVAGPMLVAQPGPRPPGGPAAQVLLTPAGAEAVNGAVRAADDERVAAMLAGDGARLGAILSEGLHYAHSNGAVDSKATFIESLTSKRVAYESIAYTKREFLIAADDVVLMTGRARIRAGLKGQANDIDLNFLAVWRLEAGRWKFLAWQSSRNPPASVQ